MVIADTQNQPAPTAHEQLREGLKTFLSLNPDGSVTRLPELEALARRATGERFDELTAFAEDLIDRYLSSPWKRAEHQIVREYLGFIDRATHLLTAGDDSIQDTPPPSPGAVALVPARQYSSCDWCRVLSLAEVPKPLLRAVDAARNRNELTPSVIEYMVYLLHLVDGGLASAWEARFLETQRGRLDPDVARDFLRAWRRLNPPSIQALLHAMDWSADTNLERNWPSVIREADLLLREGMLKRMVRTLPDRTRNLRHLRLLAERPHLPESELLRWLEVTIADMGASVHFFIRQNQQLVRELNDGRPTEWRRAAMMREIGKVEQLFPLILLLADVIFAAPQGAYRLALSLFGLTGEVRDDWLEHLEKTCAEMIRHHFLDALRKDIPADEVIRRFCFGDHQLFRQLASEVDLVTKQFTSVRDRDRIVEYLAVYLASYREENLFAEEIAQRYRRLMRVLHEDSLRRLLTPEQFESVRGMDVLTELSAMVSDARRYLGRRRALQLSLEELVASEMDFVQGVRRRRLTFIHRRLVREPSASDDRQERTQTHDLDP